MESPETRLWVITTTFPNADTARQAAQRLVAEELAACAQVGAGLRSFYRWRGALQEEDEIAVELKVAEERYAACAARLRELHPYAVPQIVGWPAARVDDAYLRWVRGEEDQR